MSVSSVTARCIATWFGSGSFPVAPGTAAAVATLPLHYALRAAGPIPHAAVSIALTCAGVWAAERHATALGEKDPSSAVIDEVAGTLISMGLARPSGLGGELIALALFRVLDIYKPGIIARAERLRPNGLGIMADDVLAGLSAGLLVRWLLRSARR